MHTGKSLTIKDNNIVDGTEIVQYNYQGLDSQKWILRDSGINGWIISPLNNLELALSVNGTIENGAKLILDQSINSDSQMFYLFNISKEEKAKDNGIYKVAVGKEPTKTIEISEANTSNNSLLDIWDFR